MYLSIAAVTQRLNAQLCLLLALSIALLIPSSAQAQFAGAVSAPAEYDIGFKSITKRDAKRWLNVLAGNSFGGRGTGQVGYTKAAHWVAAKLAEFGFEPIGERGTYFQHVPLTRHSSDPNASFVAGPDGLKIQGAAEIAFVRSSARPSATGPVVWVRAKGQEARWERPESLEDKIVVLIADDISRAFTSGIARKRPAAVIRVVDDLQPSRPRITRQSSAPSRGSSRTEAEISRAAAERLAKALNQPSEAIQSLDEAGVVVADVPVDITIEQRLRSEPIYVPNVVGWLPGSDPELRDEHVIIGAHLDHLGRRGDSVYPGADDNGSGSTAILQIAQALHANPVKPKRSVLYIGFAAEEMGLIGSRYYADNPLRPLDQAICMLNIDMIGRNEQNDSEKAEDNENTIHLIGSKRGFAGLHELVLDANRHVNLEFEYDEDRVFGRSDQASFYRKGIPVTFLFGGFSPTYHQPSDTTQGINFRKITAAAKLNYLVLMKAAEHGRFEKLEE